MTTCATEKTLPETVIVGNLFLPLPETDFRDYLDKIEELAKSAPEIIKSIEQDLDVQARKAKKLRLEDKKFLESHTMNLPEMDIKERDILAEELKLAVGRPRMSGYAVYVFVMVRGFLGSLSSRPAKCFLRESMSLYGFLQNRGLSMPSVTTMLENVNFVSQKTRDLIFKKQIELILREDLDDFKELTIDSTAVKANSCWPTDVKILTGLLTRANRLGQKLHASDAVELPLAIRDSVNRTGVVAELVSTDDGYASAKGRGEVLALGVKDVSISGAKGKRLTEANDWKSDMYRNARRNRSAVESLMFTIKDGFEFGELGRRGLESVRGELFEKVLAYNCCRIILVKKRKRDLLDEAA